jgi:hypothetical protein
MDFDASRLGFLMDDLVKILFAAFSQVKGFLARLSFGFGIFGTHCVSGEHGEGFQSPGLLVGSRVNRRQDIQASRTAQDSLF